MSQVSQSFFSRLFFLSSRSPNYIVLVKGNPYRAIDRKKFKSHVGLEEQWSGSDSPGWINELTESLPLGAEASPPHWEEHRASHDMLFRTKPLHQVFASFSKEVEELDLSLVSWEKLSGIHLRWLYSCCLQSRTCQEKLWRENACLDTILVMVLDAHAIGMTRSLLTSCLWTRGDLDSSLVAWSLSTVLQSISSSTGGGWFDRMYVYILAGKIS